MAKGQKRSNREKKKPKATAKKTSGAQSVSSMPAFTLHPARAGKRESR